MAIKILTKNATDNTNIDSARQFNFSAGMRSGIVKGAFSEGNLFLSSNNSIAIDTCELIISGHRVIIESPESVTFANAPSQNTQKSLIAEIVVTNGVPSFRLFAESSAYNLKQDNLFTDNNGNGTYQIEICTFLHRTDNTITDVVKTVNTITGGYGTGSESSIEDIKFNATAISLSSDSLPTANIDYNEDTKEYDLELGIPRGVPVPNTLTIGSVVGGDVASATITGDAPNQVLNLVLPKGERGEQGEQGVAGISDIYDLTIATQSEFETFYTSLDNGTCTAKSVLFVGDGGTLEFTRTDGKGLHIPSTLKVIEGKNNAIINVAISGLVENTYTSAGIYYDEVPTSNDYLINSLYIKVSLSGFMGNPAGFSNCKNIHNCEVYSLYSSGTTVSGYSCFYNCKDLYNCKGSSGVFAYRNCSNIINCTSLSIASYGFYGCDNIVNCVSEASGYNCFASCKYLSNCIGFRQVTGSSSFESCEYLTNCTSKGTGEYAYLNCSYASNCSSLGVTSVSKWGGTTLKRDDNSCDLDS